MPLPGWDRMDLDSSGHHVFLPAGLPENCCQHDPDPYQNHYLNLSLDQPEDSAVMQVGVESRHIRGFEAGHGALPLLVITV